MKIKVITIYSALFSILLLAQLYIPSFKVNIFLQIIVLGIFIFTDKAKISIQFLKKIFPILLLLVSPFIIGLFYDYGAGNFLKDFFYFLKPIIGITIGYLLFKKINSFDFFLKTVILTGLISAIIHFIILVFFTNFWSGNVSQIREFGKDNFLELFALLILWFSDRFIEKPLFTKKRKLQILLLLAVSCLLYLSRTMLVVGLIMFLAVNGYTVINAKTIKLLAAFTIGIAILYMYLFSIKIDRNADGINGFLYKLKVAPGEIFISKIDRENHKHLWDHWRAYEATRAISLMNENPSSYIFGTGYGSKINLKFYSPLGESKKGLKFISEIHNGYIFVLYKSGFLGIIMYLFFLLDLYKANYKQKGYVSNLISAIGLFYLFSSLTITGIFNKRDILIFILGALFYFSLTKKQVQ